MNSRLRLQLAIPFVVALFITSRPIAAQQAVTYSSGGNSRGYIAVNQSYPGTCGAGRGFETDAPKTYKAGDVTLNCSGPGWSGQSMMSTTARSIRAMSTVTATNLAATNLIGLATAMYVDQWTIDPLGAIPTSVTFAYDFSGFSFSSGVTNSQSSTITRFSAGFDIGVPNQLVATTPGQYNVSFAISPGMIGRAIEVSYQLTVFAQLLGLAGTMPFSGTTTADFGNTLRMSRVSFFQQQLDGSQRDVTQLVSLSSVSGADYLTPLTTVPEPSTTLLLGVGCVAIFVGLRRSRGTVG